MNSHSKNNTIITHLPSLKTFLFIVFCFFVVGFSSIVALANENTVVVLADTLNVRLGPGLSHDILTQTHKDERLQIIDEQNQWYQVRIGDDQIGWVASWLVEKEEISSDTVQYGRVVNAPEVNLRQYANIDSEIIGTIPENTELEIVYQEDTWYQVIYSGKVAWIHSDYIELIESPTVLEATTEKVVNTDSFVTVEADYAEIYSEPTSESVLLYQTGYGEQFTYLYSVGDWFYVEIEPDVYGYIGNWLASAHVEEHNEEVEVSAEENIQSYVARANTNLSEATIVIDAGHGGTDPGAISTDESTLEKDLTLRTAEKLQARLQAAGTNVIMTRIQDTDVSLAARASLAAQYNADLFISLHYDALEVPNMMSGTTTYYYDEQDLAIAETINSYLTSMGTLPNNGIRFGNYQVLRDNLQPAILVELGYMNHFADVEQIRTDNYQTVVSEAIYQALREYYGQ